MSNKSQTFPTSNSVLIAAAGRRSGNVLPLPNDADLALPRTARVINSLLQSQHIEECITTSFKLAWRSDEAGKHYLLRITAAGRATLEAAGAVGTETVVELPSGKPDAPPIEAKTIPGGKLGLVLSAVKATAGASMSDLIALTGWQAHTIRASLSRLRQTGVSIELSGDNDNKRYVAAEVAQTRIA